jgi:hypothetical protein
MTIWRSQLNNFRLRQLAVTVLAIWLSGATCLLCCGPMQKPAAETESCSSIQVVNDSSIEDDCCEEKLAGDHSSSEVPCQDKCCILNAPASEPPGNFKLNQVLAISSPTALIPSLISHAKSDGLFFAHQHLPQSQTIHLRCCVFLI